MSRRRSRHQVTRRRIYRARHHELRERRLDAAGEARHWLSDQIAASKIEAAVDFGRRPPLASTFAGGGR